MPQAHATIDEDVPEGIMVPYVLSDTQTDELGNPVNTVTPYAATYGPCTLKLDDVHRRKSAD